MNCYIRLRPCQPSWKAWFLRTFDNDFGVKQTCHQIMLSSFVFSWYMYNRVIHFGIFLWFVWKIYFYFMRKLHFWHYFWWFTLLFPWESSKIVSCRSHYCVSSLSFVEINCACSETHLFEPNEFLKQSKKGKSWTLY